MSIESLPDGAWSAQWDIPYRGTRNYLHGTDLFKAASALVEAAAGDSRVVLADIRFPRFTTRNGRFYLTPHAADRMAFKSSSVRIQAKLDDGRLLTGWYEELDTNPGERSDNFESAIVEQTRLDVDTATYLGDSGPPLIEIIVFSMKKLVQTRHPISRGKWVFTALRSERLIAEDDSHRVSLKLAGSVSDRAASAVVSLDSRELGEIYFGSADA